MFCSIFHAGLAITVQMTHSSLQLENVAVQKVNKWPTVNVRRAGKVGRKDLLPRYREERASITVTLLIN